MSFKKAERKNAKLRLALSGTSGAGKTWNALLMAKEIGGQKIAVMDSERGSASLYAGTPGLPEFDVCELEEKNIQEYIEKVQEAAAAGYDVLIVDSYSHSWIGALEQVDKMGGSKFSNGWKVIAPLVTKLVDTILSYPGHVICTMRSKAEYAIEKDEKTGKAVPKKMGMATVARDGTDYEFSVMLDLTVEGGVSVSKTRCAALTGGIYTRQDIPKIAAKLKAWLSEGATESAFDALASRIRFAGDDATLQARAPEIKAAVDEKKITADERAKLLELYKKRKAEFQGVAE